MRVGLERSLNNAIAKTNADKTGTLTLNQMTARKLFYRGRYFTVSGEGYTDKGIFSADDGGQLPDFLPLLIPAVLCSESRIRDG